MDQRLYSAEDLPCLGVQSEEVVTSHFDHDYCTPRFVPVTKSNAIQPRSHPTAYVRPRTNMVDLNPIRPTYKIYHPYSRPGASLVNSLSVHKPLTSCPRPGNSLPLRMINGMQMGGKPVFRYQLAPVRSEASTSKICPTNASTTATKHDTNNLSVESKSATNVSKTASIELPKQSITPRKVEETTTLSNVKPHSSLVSPTPQLKKPTILSPSKWSTPKQSPKENESSASSCCIKRSPENILSPISPLPAPKKSRKQLFVCINELKPEKSSPKENGNLLPNDEDHKVEVDESEAKIVVNKVDLSDITIKAKKIYMSPKKPKEQKEPRIPKKHKESSELKELKEKKSPKSKGFKQRTEGEITRLIYAFEKEGFDEEDYQYLEEGVKFFQNGDEPIPWTRKLTWVTPKNVSCSKVFRSPRKDSGIPNYFDDPELEGLIPNSSGCARTQGYSKPTKFQKYLQRLVDRKLNGHLVLHDYRGVRHKILVNKSERTGSGRRIQPTAIVDEYFKGKLAFHKKKIKFSKSSIHGWGLFAMENIAPDELIIEYLGELIRPAVSDMRELEYEKKGVGASYFFKIDDDLVIDATNHGNFSRFVNHSCRPNCYARIITIDGSKHIYIYSRTHIEAGEELTYNYKFPFEEQKIECHCGVKGCKRFLN